MYIWNITESLKSLTPNFHLPSHWHIYHLAKSFMVLFYLARPNLPMAHWPDNIPFSVFKISQAVHINSLIIYSQLYSHYVHRHPFFENFTFFHAKLGSDVCPRVDNQTSVDTLQDSTRPLVEKSPSASYPPKGTEASFWWQDALPHQPVQD